MPLDLVQLLAHLLARHVRVVQVALLDARLGEEVLVVFEGVDFVGSYGWLVTVFDEEEEKVEWVVGDEELDMLLRATM